MGGRKQRGKAQDQSWKCSTPEPSSPILIPKGSIYERINMPAARIAALKKGLVQDPIKEKKFDTNNNNTQSIISNLNDTLNMSFDTRMKSVVCICDRPKANILCAACGYSNYGRVRMQCFVHCRLTYLLDLDVCPRCHSKALVELKGDPNQSFN